VGKITADGTTIRPKCREGETTCNCSKNNFDLRIVSAETLLSGLQDYNGRRETRLEIKAKQRGTSSERERVSETKIVTKRKAWATHKVD
jgi:hypothetical protein